MKKLKKFGEKTEGRRAAKNGAIWVFVIILLAIGMFIPGVNIVISLILSICAICGMIRLCIKSVSLKRAIRFNTEELVPYIKKNYPEAVYEPDKFFITKKELGKNMTATRWIKFPDFPDHYNVAKGQDYLSWKTKAGTPFKYCEVDFTYVHSSGKSATVDEVFSGALLATMSHKAKEITSPIYLHSTDTDAYVDRYKYIETENVEFNEYFTCHCDSSHDLFYMLTPQLMEKLIELNKNIGDFHLWVKTNGEILFAIPKLDLFNGRKSKDARIQAKEDIALLEGMAEIIDYEDDLKIGKKYMHKKEPLKINEHRMKKADEELQNAQLHKNREKAYLTLFICIIICTGMLLIVGIGGGNQDTQTVIDKAAIDETRNTLTDWEEKKIIDSLQMKYKDKQFKINKDSIDKDRPNSTNKGSIGKVRYQFHIDGQAICLSDNVTFEFSYSSFEYYKGSELLLDDSYGYLEDGYQTIQLLTPFKQNVIALYPGYNVTIKTPLCGATQYVSTFEEVLKVAIRLEIKVLHPTDDELCVSQEHQDDLEKWIRATSPYNTMKGNYTVTFKQRYLTAKDTRMFSIP